MTGIVDSWGRALVRIRLRNPASQVEIESDVWIDTGFTGDLVLPERLLEYLGLQPASKVKAELGDGSEATFKTYAVLLQWFGSWKELQALGSTVEVPLIGVSLLKGHKLAIDYEDNAVSLR